MITDFYQPSLGYCDDVRVSWLEEKKCAECSEQNFTPKFQLFEISNISVCFIYHDYRLYYCANTLSVWSRPGKFGSSTNRIFVAALFVTISHTFRYHECQVYPERVIDW